MSGIISRLPLLVASGIVSGGVGWFFREVFRAWGVLDPYAATLGGWLKMNVTPEMLWNGVGLFVFAALWIIALLHFRNGKSEHRKTLAPELEQLMRDIGRMEEMLMGRGNINDIKEELDDRLQRVNNSDHPIWHSEPAKQLRRDFINRCGSIKDDRINGVISRQNFEEAKREMKEFADQLLSELKEYRGP